MTNIYGKTENLELYNKDGKRVYVYYIDDGIYSWEYTYN